MAAMRRTVQVALALVAASAIPEMISATELAPQDSASGLPSATAITNFILAIGTIAIAAFTCWLAVINERLANIQQLQFAIAHRPCLIVRLIRLSPDHESLKYEIRNVGGTRAEIVAIHEGICGGSEEAAWAEVTEPFSEKRNVTNLFLDAGQPHQRTYGFPDKFRGHLGFAIAADPTSRYQLLFRGYIVYKDVHAGIGRRIAFQRVFDRDSERFVPMEPPDTDYEHAD